MIKASVAYEMMEKALHLIPSHESTSTYLSAYGVFNLESGDCVAVRAANHGTFLYNWLKMQDEPFNVDLLTSANVALTFLDGSIPFSHNNNIEMDNGAEPPVFVVRQYVYNCAVLDANDINVIISASKKLIIDGVYTDPFEEDSTKHAIIYREKTNEPSKDMTAKTLKKHRAAKKKRKLQQPTDNDNQELNTEQYMNKKAIRITESDLHRIVKESVQKIINEIGDTPRGQRALGAVAARSIHRMHNALDDDQPEEAAYWDNVANDAARIGHNNVNPDWDEETEYFDDGVDYWHDNLRQYESKNVKKDLIRLTESDLYRIVKESIDEIAKEGQEPKYNVGDYVRVHFKGEYTPITMRITRIKPIKGYGFYYDGVSNGQWHGAGEDDIDFKYDVIDDGNGGEILSPPQGVISGYRPSIKESMDKGKTTKMLSGGAYIGKDGKRHEWRKIHGYKPKKITDDNWMEYGMPADEETNESKNMNKKLIRLTEGDLHRIVKESVNRILRESETDFQTYHHIRDNGTKVIVMANFIDHTFTFERKKLGEFDSIEEAKKFVLKIANNNEYIRDLADEVYSNMDENDETRIDNIILNIYQDYGDRGLYAIGNGISVIPKY